MGWRGCSVVERRLRAALALAAVLGVQALAGGAAVPAPVQPAQPWEQSGPTLDAASIVRLNSLQRAGNPAFHIRVAFSVMDLAGRPAEQGEMEYWWAAAGSYLDLSAPSVGTVHSFALKGLRGEKARRVVFLAERLATALVNPGAMLGKRDVSLVPVPDADGAEGLQCAHPPPPPGPRSAPTPEMCADRSTGTIRMVRGFFEAVTRNRTASFGATRVALDAEISYSGKRAVAGHVEQLEGIPARAMPDFLTPSAMLEAPDGRANSGEKISGSASKYPDDAVQERLQGAIALGVEVSAEGRVDAVVVLSQGSPSLTGASVNAVSDWRFTPFLLDGQPEPIRITLLSTFVTNAR